MKKNLKDIGGILAACMLASAAHATLLLQENFTYTNGNLTAVSGGNWTAFSGGGTYPVQVSGATVNFTNVTAGTSGEDLKRDLPQPYSTGVLYMSALVAISNAPTAANGDYFLAFYSTNSSGGGYSTRIFASTITGGGWSFGNTNNGSAPVDDTTARSVATWYKLIVKYDCSAKSSAFGVFAANYVPADDSELTVVPAGTGAGPTNVSSVAIRQGGTTGAAWEGAMDYLIVGTTLADVASNAPVLPVIASQPQDGFGFATGTASFSAAAVGEAGDAPVYYQWYYNTNTLLMNSAAHFIGTTTATLTITNLVLTDAGAYSCVVSNAVGTNITRFAQLAVSPAPIPPTIDTNLPAGFTNIVGDTVTMTIAAHGLPNPAYIWQFIPATNTLVTNIVSAANVASDAKGSTLTLVNVGTNSSGKYFATITNSVAYYTTNSSMAVLKVNPPPVLTIAQVRSMVDSGFNPTNTTSLFTIQGIVTTWTNLTTSAAPEFFMQDATAGICVYWAHAGGSNCPPAGAMVRVTGTMTTFQQLLELEPDSSNALTSVTILSTNNPLPAAQPMVFDPNVLANPTAMKAMESTYLVASNVTLDAGSSFSSSGSDFMTNNIYHVKFNSMTGISFTNDVGQSVVLFINNYTDVPGRAVPTGPVTIYGVLNNYYGTYELTPTRYADIISYISTTNVLANARKGDAPTNSYTENVLRPGETQTTYVSIADPEGGSVTLTPVIAGLPASASWTVLNNGAVGNAVFTFKPTTADSGSNYLVSVGVSSTSGSVFTNTETVYVPTTNEQLMAITEFLANPTTNTAAPNFNPLKRATDTIGVSTNDQYIEVANISGSGLAAGWSLDYGNLADLLFDSYAVGAGVSVPSSNSVVIYSGGSETPGLATPNYASTLAAGLGLKVTTSSMIVLRNGNNGGGGNGNIIDRVIYSAADYSTNGSLTRFPTINSAFVPQNYVSTNPTSAGLQYDGSAWNQHFKVPAGVNNVGIRAANGKVMFNFTANTGLASTLWSAGSLTGPYNVIYGQQFRTTSGAFTNIPNGSLQFYYISNQ